ncbi:MAG: hypothetical protein MJE77_36360 [Proteobacteria bacterium]|nr:hypothetical protein [Pseudomonadota bacterium]
MTTMRRATTTTTGHCGHTISACQERTGMGAVAIAVAVVVWVACSPRNEAQSDRVAPSMEPRQAEAMAHGEGLTADQSTRVSNEELNEVAQAGSTLKKEVARRQGKGKLGQKDAERKPEADSEPQTRSWFPETFLFEPAVVTDDQGKAEVRVRVPDRLTTWRVLALAHSRTGAQAGAVASFTGTLPAYVDPIVPPLLRAGDRVRIPVQLVNTTAETITAALVLETAGAELEGIIQTQTMTGQGRPGQGGRGYGRVRATVEIPARGSLIRYVTMRVQKPGTVHLRARLGQEDAVVRTIDVLPTGRPVKQSRTGTLAAPRQFDITGPADADAELDRARLLVFPGALAILRSELAASSQRGGVADDAFALLLAGTAPELLQALGDQPDREALRALGIVATQRVIRHARVFDVPSATLIARAALAHEDNPVLTRLGQRAVQHLKSHQAPDGTCGGESGWSLQRLLVATADCARAASTARDVVIRASGAFERQARHVRDPYTAAAILASGAVSGPLAQTLRERVIAAIRAVDDGAKALAVPRGVTRADGIAPSQIEATAVAVLALAGSGGADQKGQNTGDETGNNTGNDALLADLGASLLSSYSPERGWGDGRANQVCLEAVLRLFRDPIPPNIAVTLSVDGQVIGRGALDRDRVRDVLVVQADPIAVPLAGARTWQVRAQPAVPGLGFALSVTSWVPWQKTPSRSGVELSVVAPARAEVGKAAELAVRATAPSGRALRMRIELPAGLQVDEASLESLVANQALARYQLPQGAVVLHINPLAPARAFTAAIRVIPTLGGTLHSGPAFIELAGPGKAIRVHQPPAVWTVK